MTPREQGFLLLTGQLGDPFRAPLTAAQFRQLSLRAKQMQPPVQDRNLTADDLITIGYDRLTAEHILTLLSQKERLERYIQTAAQRDCFPITRLTPAYPQRLRQRLQADSPGVLWYKGDLSLLTMPAISLVGSRELLPENRAFAREAGKQAARQGFVLISGNARGADLTAQESCLEHGGKVISVVADRLEKCPLHRNVLYLSESGYDLGFSPQRALSRNRIIHCLGQKVLVAQIRLRKGGTWNGTYQNLKHRWSPVFCFDDRSLGTNALLAAGAAGITQNQLQNLSALPLPDPNIFDQ